MTILASNYVEENLTKSSSVIRAADSSADLINTIKKIKKLEEDQDPGELLNAVEIRLNDYQKTCCQAIAMPIAEN